MTALEGNGVDLPDIALVAERIDVTILDRLLAVPGRSSVEKA